METNYSASQPWRPKLFSRSLQQLMWLLTAIHLYILSICNFNPAGKCTWKNCCEECDSVFEYCILRSKQCQTPLTWLVQAPDPGDPHGSSPPFVQCLQTLDPGAEEDKLFVL